MSKKPKDVSVIVMDLFRDALAEEPMRSGIIFRDKGDRTAIEQAREYKRVQEERGRIVRAHIPTRKRDKREVQEAIEKGWA